MEDILLQFWQLLLNYFSFLQNYGYINILGQATFSIVHGIINVPSGFLKSQMEKLIQ